MGVRLDGDILVLNQNSFNTLQTSIAGNCAGLQKYTITPKSPVIQTSKDAGHTQGQTLEGKITIVDPRSTDPENIKVDYPWSDRNPPEYDPYIGNWWKGSKGNAENDISIYIRGAWELASGTDDMDKSWALKLAKAYTYTAESDSEIGFNAISDAARKELKKGSLARSAGPLIFKSKFFAVEAIKRLIGVQKSKFFNYKFRSRYWAQPKIITTKDGTGNISYKILGQGNERQGGGSQVLEEGCAKAIYVYNENISTIDGTPPNTSVTMDDELSNGDKDPIIAELFNSFPSNTTFENWLTGTLAPAIEQFYNAPGVGAPPVLVWDTSNVKWKFSISDTDRGNGTGSLGIKAACTWGTDENGSLWIGNFVFTLSFNIRSLLNDVRRAVTYYNQMKAAKAAANSTATTTITTVVTQAAATTPTSDLKTENNNTTTTNPTREANGPALESANNASQTSGGGLQNQTSAGDDT